MGYNGGYPCVCCSRPFVHAIFVVPNLKMPLPLPMNQKSSQYPSKKRQGKSSADNNQTTDQKWPPGLLVIFVFGGEASMYECVLRRHQKQNQQKDINTSLMNEVDEQKRATVGLCISNGKAPKRILQLHATL